MSGHTFRFSWTAQDLRSFLDLVKIFAFGSERSGSYLQLGGSFYSGREAPSRKMGLVCFQSFFGFADLQADRVPKIIERPGVFRDHNQITGNSSDPK